MEITYLQLLREKCGGVLEGGSVTSIIRIRVLYFYIFLGPDSSLTGQGSEYKHKRFQT